MNTTRFKELESQFSHKQIMVIGDLMLDNYLWGSASRISPEAPVPVVKIESRSSNPGGAANVAYNLSSLGARAALCGVIGDDKDSTVLKSLLQDLGIDIQGVIVDPGRPTTVKTRIIAHNQQVVRVDWEDQTIITSEIQEKIIRCFSEKIAGFDAVILEDYNKGLLNDFLIREIINICQENAKPVYADPKFDNFLSYKGVTLVKPNLAEASQVLGFDVASDENLIEGGQTLLKRLECEMILITRGEMGMSLFNLSGHHHISTKARSVHDVSGAGDTVIATFCLAHVSGASAIEAATLANYAAGRVCEEVGVVPITKENLHEIIVHHNS